ncbi:MAG: hypothetical protein ACSLEL_01870 [Candidatus Malihini olakiniferum]
MSHALSSIVDARGRIPLHTFCVLSKQMRYLLRDIALGAELMIPVYRPRLE